MSILGMHRSGTSSLTGSLQRAGVFTGEVIVKSPYQPNGNRESSFVNQLNDLVLSSNKASAFKPPIGLEWSKQHEEMRDKFIFDMHEKSPTWLFKDPRTLLTLPFWKEGISNLKFSGIFRDYLSVAMSLFKRSQLPLREGIKLWLQYNQILLAEHQASAFPLLCFDLKKEQYLKHLRNVLSWLDQSVSTSARLNIEAACDFYQDSAIHQRNLAVFSILESHGTEKRAVEKLIEKADEVYQNLVHCAGLKIEEVTDVSPKLYVPVSGNIGEHKQAIKAQPHNPELFMLFGHELFLQEKWLEATENYKKAIALGADYHVQVMLAKALIAANMVDEGADVLRQVQRAVPNRLLIYLKVCYFLSHRGYHTQALELSHELENSASKPDWQALKILGHIHRIGRNSQSAIVYYQKTLAYQPYDLASLIHLAMLLEKNHQLKKSKKLCKYALTLVPNHPKLSLCLAKIYSRQGQLEQAVRCCEALLNDHPDYMAAYIRLANLFRKQKRFEDAYAILEKAKKVNPNHPGIVKYLRNSGRRN